jgi:hypothetical protein
MFNTVGRVVTRGFMPLWDVGFVGLFLAPFA